MGAGTINELLAKKKQQYLKLIEVSDITRQLAEAVDRRDDVSVKIMLSMRQEPLGLLSELDEQVKSTVARLPEDEAINLSAILNGEPGSTGDEKLLAEQVAKNRRLLEQIQLRDRDISLKMDAKRSFYKKFRPNI